MRINIKNIKKSEDKEAIEQIKREYDRVMVDSIELNIRMIEAEKMGNKTKADELKSQLSLMAFNIAIIKGRKEECMSDALVRKIEGIDYCCKEMKETYEEGELFSIKQDVKEMYFTNGTFYGEVFLSEERRPVHFCQYCGNKIEFVEVNKIPTP